MFWNAVDCAVPADLDGKAAEWKSLATALRGAATETAQRRVRLQAAEARARFERTLRRSLPGARGPKGKVRPEQKVHDQRQCIPSVHFCWTCIMKGGSNEAGTSVESTSSKVVHPKLALL